MPLPNRRSSTQLELAGGRRRGTPACRRPPRRGDEEQVALVDQPGRERLGGEVGAADAEVAVRRTPSAAGPRRGRSPARSASARWRPSSSVLEYTILSAACQISA